MSIMLFLALLDRCGNLLEHMAVSVSMTDKARPLLTPVFIPLQIRCGAKIGIIHIPASTAISP
jgi:hypothetical protein